jgi:hypothetical protein
VQYFSTFSSCSTFTCSVHIEILNIDSSITSSHIFMNTYVYVLIRLIKINKIILCNDKRCLLLFCSYMCCLYCKLFISLIISLVFINEFYFPLLYERSLITRVCVCVCVCVCVHEKEIYIYYAM